VGTAPGGSLTLRKIEKTRERLRGGPVTLIEIEKTPNSRGLPCGIDKD